MNKRLMIIVLNLNICAMQNEQQNFVKNQLQNSDTITDSIKIGDNMRILDLDPFSQESELMQVATSDTLQTLPKNIQDIPVLELDSK